MMKDKIKKLYWVLGVLVLSALLIGCESMKASSENNNKIEYKQEGTSGEADLLRNQVNW